MNSSRTQRHAFIAIIILLATALACNLGAGPSKQNQATGSAPSLTPSSLPLTLTAASTSAPATQTLTSSSAAPTASLDLAATAAAYEASAKATFLAGPQSRTQPAPNTELVKYNYYSFEPLSFSSDYYWMRHQNFLGELTLVSTDLDYADATFRVVPGRAQNDCISFESFNLPGYFLRHSNFRIRLDPPDGTQLFDEDSTFCPQIGLAHPLGISFRAFAYYGFYLRHRDFHLYVEQGTDDQFRFDATWVFASPLAH